MKQMEIKRFTIGSVLKSTIYLYFIPIVLLLIVGIIATMAGVASEGPTGLIGLGFVFLILILYTGFYLGIIALMTLIYNWLAGKFGGLTFMVEEKEDWNQNN